ncbi:HlyD family efflux transporter periplasmic adaptor subunit [Methylobacterium soli]|uniref:HlyD family efflux transporter periplasmic adaptor subunit n=2 Tax=Methylobacterium soli TaxID=553447 RepID=A0A6L3SVS6_9HYPH|nr:HlyD family efflux transporter periplasmic adaptor subunit [Methylobacterium soli]
MPEISMPQKLAADVGAASDRASQASRQRTQTRIVRISSYSVAGVLAVLMTTATLPPLLADQSDRAVINAPITLLTAPITGEVIDLLGRVGQRLEPGQAVAYLHNGRVDRSTLIGLDSKVDELEGSLVAAREKKDSDLRYVAALDGEIRQQTEQMIARLQGEVAEARARVSSADAEGQSTKAVVDRQQSMVDRNTASIDLLRPTQHKLEAARFDKDAETAKLNQKLAQLEGVRKGVFVGNELNSLAVLAQKRRDLAFDAQRLAIEESQLAASLKAQRTLLGAEKKRLDSLTDAQMRAMNGGVVMNLGVAPGRHVNPGDSVATLIDCDQAFVVGIFSYRQAQDLAVGTPVRISGSNPDGPRRGTVSEILPKTSDKTDEQYAVPFPQTERREMYVLVSLDRDQPARPAASVLAPTQSSPCSVGQWVTITRENSWLPSASVAWRTVADGVSGKEVGNALNAVAGGVSSASAAVLRGVTSPEAKDAWGAVSSGAVRTAGLVANGVSALVEKVTAPKITVPAQGKEQDGRRAENGR